MSGLFRVTADKRLFLCLECPGLAVCRPPYPLPHPSPAQQAFGQFGYYAPSPAGNEARDADFPRPL